jgi:hypothetical protein
MMKLARLTLIAALLLSNSALAVTVERPAREPIQLGKTA